MQIGENIKKHLRARNLSIADLVIKTGLKKADVTNILCNRSKKHEKLQLIADALNIPLSDLLPIVMQVPFQYKTYVLAVNVVGKNFDSLNIATKKEIFDEFVVRIYNYIIANEDKVEKDFLIYCEGLLRGAVTIGAITIQGYP